jgi:hypothetical protein
MIRAEEFKEPAIKMPILHKVIYKLMWSLPKFTMILSAELENTILKFGNNKKQ